MPRFRITPRARDDLKDIGRYTEWQWGKNQRNTYLRDFEKRFHLLAENLLLGKHRSDISEGYYSYPQGQHVIFYLIGQGCIEIIGIPHKEMDIVSNVFQCSLLWPFSHPTRTSMSIKYIEITAS